MSQHPHDPASSELLQIDCPLHERGKSFLLSEDTSGPDSSPWKRTWVAGEIATYLRICRLPLFEVAMCKTWSGDDSRGHGLQNVRRLTAVVGWASFKSPHLQRPGAGFVVVQVTRFINLSRTGSSVGKNLGVRV